MVIVPDDELYDKVVIIKPETFRPENIAQGVIIAELKGHLKELEKCQHSMLRQYQEVEIQLQFQIQVQMGILIKVLMFIPEKKWLSIKQAQL